MDIILITDTYTGLLTLLVIVLVGTPIIFLLGRARKKRTDEIFRKIINQSPGLAARGSWFRVYYSQNTMDEYGDYGVLTLTEDGMALLTGSQPGDQVVREKTIPYDSEISWIGRSMSSSANPLAPWFLLDHQGTKHYFSAYPGYVAFGWKAKTKRVYDSLSKQLDNWKRSITSITLWAKDEQTADRICKDRYFLYGLLMGDGGNASKRFLDALRRGGSLSFDVSPNSASGGYDINITLRAEKEEKKNSKNRPLESLILLLDDPNVEMRCEAAEELGRLGDPCAIEPLYNLMKKESLRILQATASLYGGGGLHQASAETLVKAGVRRKAADALGLIGTAAVPTLIAALENKDERFQMIREQAARVLGEMKAADAVGPLIQALKDDNGYLKQAAAKALESIGGTDAEQALTEHRARKI